MGRDFQIFHTPYNFLLAINIFFKKKNLLLIRLGALFNSVACPELLDYMRQSFETHGVLIDALLSSAAVLAVMSIYFCNLLS